MHYKKQTKSVISVRIKERFLFQLVLTSVLIAVGSCGRLEPQYLPPRTGGGFGGGAGSGAGGGYGGSGAGGSHGGGSGSQIPITRFENVNNGDGSYHFRCVLILF